MSTDNTLPDAPLIAWYGDDFTGAAAVLEVLTFAGLPSALFLALPTATQLARFPDLKGIGVASVARAKSPAWMEENLPPAFRFLAKLCDGILHYKVCSTLDSSPYIGSIGKAIEIGAEVMNTQCIPILIAAPPMRRYQCFGHLFAAMGDEVFRIDRHPVMRRHPVTPMPESDVAEHLRRQSEAVTFDTVNLERLRNPSAAIEAFSNAGVTGLAIDNIDATSEAAAGALIWGAREACRFVVGSQGVEYALIRHWRDRGLLAESSPPQGIGATERMVVVSGSVSPVTAQQIGWACDNGYVAIKFDVLAACRDAQDLADETQRVIDAASAVLKDNADPLIYTAQGADDGAVADFYAALESARLDGAAVNEKVGRALGRILATLVQDSGVSRAVIAGGDTSGYAVQQLGVFALTALAPTFPGAPLCRVHADNHLDGLELALKGGQMGGPDYFGWIKNGGGER